MASTSLFLVLTALMLVVTVQAQNKYAEKVKACYDKEKTNSDTCFKDVMHELRPNLIAGDTEAKMNSLDPLKVGDLQMEQQGTVVQGKATFTNITVLGPGQYQIKTIQYHRANKSITADVHIPSLYLTGQHVIDITLLLLPVSGKGNMYLNLTDIDGYVVCHLKKQGALMDLYKLDVSFNIKSIKIDLDGLLGDDAVAGAVKNMLNDNSQAILEDIRKQVEEAIAKTLTPILDVLIKQLPD